MAISAVSSSRISPTITILGSCLKILLKALAKVKLALLFTWTWFTPEIVYSTGSSTVITLTDSLFISLIKLYNVVDLPQPVGPVNKIIP